MLYSIARPVARYVLLYHYRHIDVSGLEHIPTSGPVILAMNHPTAFIEPCILACFQPRDLYFLARGNLFHAAWSRFLLGALHILPVFRLKDAGYGRLKDNYETFDNCHAALEAGSAIMIMAEGSCVHEKKLRPLRKGTAKIALGALSKSTSLKDIPIVPVGANFSHPDRVRSTVLLRFGPPVSTAEFLATYQAHENRGISKLTQAIRAALSPLVLQLPDDENEEVAEGYLTLARSETGWPLQEGLTKEGGFLDTELAAVGRLPLASEPTAALRTYFCRLHQLGLEDAAVQGTYQPYLHRSFWGWLKTLLAVVVLLWHLPLWLLGEYIGGVRTHLIEFYASVRFAVITVGTLVYPFLWLIGLSPWVIAYSLLAIISVRWALREWEATQRWYAARKAWRQRPEENSFLQQLRAKILPTKP